MLNRQTTLTRAQSARAENPQGTKAKPAVVARAVEPTTRRAALKDLTNVAANAANTQAGRVKKLIKAPAVQASKVPVASKAVKQSTKRPAESEPDQIEEMDAMEIERSHKKRKSEPSADDRMALEEPRDPSAEAESSAEDVMDSQPLDLQDEDLADLPHEDIDLYDNDDAQAVVEYVDDIYNHMRGLEVRSSPSSFELQISHLSFPFSFFFLRSPSFSAKVHDQPSLHGQPSRCEREDESHSRRLAR